MESTFIMAQVDLLTDEQRKEVARYGFVSWKIEYEAKLDLGLAEREQFVRACKALAK